MIILILKYLKFDINLKCFHFKIRKNHGYDNLNVVIALNTIIALRLHSKDKLSRDTGKHRSCML